MDNDAAQAAATLHKRKTAEAEAAPHREPKAMTGEQPETELQPKNDDIVMPWLAQLSSDEGTPACASCATKDGMASNGRPGEGGKVDQEDAPQRRGGGMGRWRKGRA